MDSKRALIRPQKGTLSKPIKRLLEAKRPCIEFQGMENYLQISAPVPPKPPPTPPKEGRNKWGNDLKTKSAKGQSGLLCKSLSVWHSPWGRGCLCLCCHNYDVLMRTSFE